MNPAPLFLKLPIERRALAFAQAATQRGLDAAILEKDFWVCWLLGMLFSLPEIGPHLVFKGGTSLSKVFGVIDRFSEDVDLSVSPALVGADAQAFEALTSRTQRDVAMAELRALSCQKVRHFIAPLLEAEILRARQATEAGKLAVLRNRCVRITHTAVLLSGHPNTWIELFVPDSQAGVRLAH